MLRYTKRKTQKLGAFDYTQTKSFKLQMPFDI